MLHEPMILLLLAAGAVYLFLGDREEAILLLGSSGLIVGIVRDTPAGAGAFWQRPFSFATGPLPAFFQRSNTGGMTYAPRTDVYEKGNTLVFKAELPGLKKEDVFVADRPRETGVQRG